MASDIEIAQQAKLKRISSLAQERLGIDEQHLESYGHYKAKISLDYLQSLPRKPEARLILVTAISPTPAGVGLIAVTRMSLASGLCGRLWR